MICGGLWLGGRSGILPPVKSASKPIASLLVLAVLAAACGGDDASESTEVSSTDAATTDPATTDAATTDPATTDSAEDMSGTEMSAADAAAIDELAEGLLLQLAENQVSAIYVAVSDPARGTYVAAYGDAAAGGDAASVDDSMRIGSVTKTLTATVILELVDEGVLTLDDTIEQQLPDLAAEYPDIAGITLRQLLSMTSGIPDYLNVPDGVVASIVEDPMRVWSTDELIAAGIAGGLAPAGTAGYSTTNYLILQEIVEEVTGMPLADAIGERITEPLEMVDSVLPPDDDTALPAPLAAGYAAGSCVEELQQSGADIDEPVETTDWNASYGQGGGGMTSTIGDLLIWAHSEVGTSLLSDETADERRNYSPIPEGLNYGLGMFELGSWVGHTGEAIGWEALAVHDPATGVSVAMAGNGCGGIFAGFLALLDELYPDGGALDAISGG